MKQAAYRPMLWRVHLVLWSLDCFVMPERALMVGMQPLTWHFLAASDYAKMVSVIMSDEDFSGNKRFTVHGPHGFKMFDALKLYCELLRPGLPVEQLSSEAPRSLLRKTKNTVGLSALLISWHRFETFGETGNPQSAEALLGEPMLTLEEWARSRWIETRFHRQYSRYCSSHVTRKPNPPRKRSIKPRREARSVVKDSTTKDKPMPPPTETAEPIKPELESRNKPSNRQSSKR
ncbi:MAG: hypothetical protein IPP40_13135 [bacterium]|nr:hypothetical protein [bacterium]